MTNNKDRSITFLIGSTVVLGVSLVGYFIWKKSINKRKQIHNSSCADCEHNADYE